MKKSCFSRFFIDFPLLDSNDDAYEEKPEENCGNAKNVFFKKNAINGLSFKLDLSKVNNNTNGVAKEPNLAEVVGFHQEFMSKINEFSQSWRDAAMNERKIP